MVTELVRKSVNLVYTTRDFQGDMHQVRVRSIGKKKKTR